MVQVDELINGLPEKYLTPIGERGSFVSDGQMQRICLARTLIRQVEKDEIDIAVTA